MKHIFSFEGTANATSANVNLHFSGEFDECREALKQVIKALQARLDAQAKCPFYEQEKIAH